MPIKINSQNLIVKNSSKSKTIKGIQSKKHNQVPKTTQSNQRHQLKLIFVDACFLHGITEGGLIDISLPSAQCFEDFLQPWVKHTSKMFECLAPSVEGALAMTNIIAQVWNVQERGVDETSR